MGERYYTVKEVADMLGVCNVTVLRRIRAGEIKKDRPVAEKLPHSRIGLKRIHFNM